jgi:hypothetical protein
MSMPGKKVRNAVPACIPLRKNFQNGVPACSVAKIPLHLLLVIDFVGC